MVGIFDLPSEIIFAIIDHVLSRSYPLPPHAKRCRPNANTGSRTIVCVAASDSPWSPNALNLLLTNWRLYVETTEYLKSSNNFELDLAIVNNHWIWPTWKHIPIKTTDTTLDRVEVNVIPCCTKDERIMQTDWAIWSSLLTETYLMRCVFIIVYNLIANGPSATDLSNIHLIQWESVQVSEQQSSLRITNLVINVDSKWYRSGNETIPQEIIPLRKVEGLAHLDFDPLYPIDSKSINDLVRRGFGPALSKILRADEQSRMILEKYIGKIIFQVDGHTKREFTIRDVVSTTW